MLASLLTQLLGKVAEAVSKHAKACSFPISLFRLCCALCFCCVWWSKHSGSKWLRNHLHEQHELMAPTISHHLAI